MNFLILDVGTSSMRGILFRAHGHSTLILPHLRVAQVIAVLIYWNHRRTLGGNRHRVDGLSMLPRPGSGLLYNRRHMVLKIQRILLHPAMIQGNGEISGQCPMTLSQLTIIDLLATAMKAF